MQGCRDGGPRTIRRIHVYFRRIYDRLASRFGEQNDFARLSMSKRNEARAL
jgi:hypothetical protein